MRANTAFYSTDLSILILVLPDSALWVIKILLHPPEPNSEENEERRKTCLLLPTAFLTKTPARHRRRPNGQFGTIG